MHCSTLRGWIGNAGRGRAVLFCARGARLFEVTLLALVLLATKDPPAAAQPSPPAGGAAQPAPATYSDAVQVLAREQSAAEQYAVILDRFGKNDTPRYIQGITRYADAKADFDGLIEALKTDLIQGSDQGNSPKLADALRAAAEKRVAFTSFVAEQVVGDKERAKGLLPDVVKVVPDLIRALTDAGVGIWRESTGLPARSDATRSAMNSIT